MQNPDERPYVVSSMRPARGSASALAHETGAALTFVQPAIARAQVALHAPVLEHDATTGPRSW